MEELTQEKLKETLNYNPNTGIFTWKKQISKKSTIGRVAGSNRGDGYKGINLYNKSYYAHRLAWLYKYGYLPENDVDHINRNKSDNRIINLREVSRQCNLRNSSLNKNNTSGVSGVSFDKGSNSWKAQITVNKKRHIFCYDKDFSEAVCYRLAVEQCLNWEGCDESSTAYLYVQKMLSGDKK